MTIRFMLHRSQRRAILVALGIVIFSRVGMSFAMDALNIHLKKEPVPIRRALADFDFLGLQGRSSSDHQWRSSPTERIRPPESSP